MKKVNVFIIESSKFGVYFTLSLNPHLKGIFSLHFKEGERHRLVASCKITPGLCPTLEI